MWTEDIPKINGWYWVRNKKSKDVWVERVEYSGYWFEALDEWIIFTKQDKLEFFGPLEEPN